MSSEARPLASVGSSPPAGDDPAPVSVTAVVPGLVRLAATSWWRTVQWSLNATRAAGGELVRAVATGESPAQVMAETAADLRSAARAALGIADGREPQASATTGRPGSRGRPPTSIAELRARGAALLYDSADVWFEDGVHPAFERILSEISPDEARILRLLAREGPQPSVDVRTNRPLGVGSELVASGLSMIGLEAGVRHLDRTRSDLNNLERLGLVWFSREQVSDPSRYQVVEVQPDVLEAMRAAGRSPRTVHRSIHLTPFGEDFCDTCLPIDGGEPPPAAEPADPADA